MSWVPYRGPEGGEGSGGRMKKRRGRKGGKGGEGNRTFISWPHDLSQNIALLSQFPRDTDTYHVDRKSHMPLRHLTGDGHITSAR